MCLELDIAPLGERLEQGHALLFGDLELVEQCAVQAAVAHADPVAAQADRREALAGKREHLHVAGRAGHADQLDASLEELG